MNVQRFFIICFCNHRIRIPTRNRKPLFYPRIRMIPISGSGSGQLYLKLKRTLKFATYKSQLFWECVLRGSAFSYRSGPFIYDKSPVFWIRIGFLADPDPAFFYLNADPDPDPGSKRMRIRDILVRIRILGSVDLNYGSGSRSCSFRQ
jgi:hypothetical protein